MLLILSKTLENRACLFAWVLFNHESQDVVTFVTRKIVEGAVKIKLNKQKNSILEIYTPNDWGYAKEYVEAMWKMTQQKNQVILLYRPINPIQ